MYLEKARKHLFFGAPDMTHQKRLVTWTCSLRIIDTGIRRQLRKQEPTEWCVLPRVTQSGLKPHVKTHFPVKRALDLKGKSHMLRQKKYKLRRKKLLQGCMHAEGSAVSWGVERGWPWAGHFSDLGWLWAFRRGAEGWLKQKWNKPTADQGAKAGHYTLVGNENHCGMKNSTHLGTKFSLLYSLACYIDKELVFPKSTSLL